MPAEFDLASVEQGILGTRFAGRTHHFDSVDSTNQLALYAAQAGAKWGAWIADEQTAGRGRGGHSWHSATGEGIYLSALVTPWIPMQYAVELPMAAGLATQAAVLECTGLRIDLRWPNDLMVAHRKCGGILVESASEAAPKSWPKGVDHALRYAVVGIGLNVGHTSFPPELSESATSLHIETGRVFAREGLIASMLRYLDEEVKRIRRSWLGMDNGRDLRGRFTERSSWVSGKRVRVGEGGGYTGWTRGLNPQGFLLVEDDSGTIRTVLSGGVREA